MVNPQMINKSVDANDGSTFYNLALKEITMQANIFNDMVDTIHKQTKTFLNTIDPSETYTQPLRAVASANTEFVKSWSTATQTLTDAYTAAAKS